MRDEEMILFVQSDSGYSPVIRMKQPATGVRRKVLKQFAPPPDNTPELHEARPIVKLFYLETMETGQRLDRVVKNRRGELGLPRWYKHYTHLADLRKALVSQNRISVSNSALCMCRRLTRGLLALFAKLEK